MRREITENSRPTALACRRIGLFLPSKETARAQCLSRVTVSLSHDVLLLFLFRRAHQVHTEEGMSCHGNGEDRWCYDGGSP